MVVDFLCNTDMNKFPFTVFGGRTEIKSKRIKKFGFKKKPSSHISIKIGIDELVKFSNDGQLIKYGLSDTQWVYLKIQKQGRKLKCFILNKKKEIFDSLIIKKWNKLIGTIVLVFSIWASGLNPERTVPKRQFDIKPSMGGEPITVMLRGGDFPSHGRPDNRPLHRSKFGPGSKAQGAAATEAWRRQRAKSQTSSNSASRKSSNSALIPGAEGFQIKSLPDHRFRNHYYNNLFPDGNGGNFGPNHGGGSHNHKPSGPRFRVRKSDGESWFSRLFDTEHYKYQTKDPGPVVSSMTIRKADGTIQRFNRTSNGLEEINLPNNKTLSGNQTLSSNQTIAQKPATNQTLPAKGSGYYRGEQQQFTSETYNFSSAEVAKEAANYATTSNLQHTFDRHQDCMGMKGINKNKENLAEFNNRTLTMIRKLDTEIINGSFEYKTPAQHAVFTYDPENNKNITIVSLDARDHHILQMRNPTTEQIDRFEKDGNIGTDRRPRYNDSKASSNSTLNNETSGQ